MRQRVSDMTDLNEVSREIGVVRCNGMTSAVVCLMGGPASIAVLGSLSWPAVIFGLLLLAVAVVACVFTMRYMVRFDRLRSRQRQLKVPSGIDVHMP